MAAQAPYMMTKRITNETAEDDMYRIISMIFGVMALLAPFVSSASCSCIFAAVSAGDEDYTESVSRANKTLSDPKSSDYDKARACSHLGYCYYNGNGVARDIDRALALWERAYEYDKQTPRALTLAEVYGYCTSRYFSPEKSISWYEKASPYNTEAALFLAKSYEQGYVEFNGGQGKTVTDRSVISRHDRGKSLFYYEEYLSHLSAINYMKEFIDVDPAMEYYVANCYYNGDGVEKDFEKAVYWYKQCIEHCNDSDTFYNRPYKRHSGLTDAELGEACWNLSICYRFGRGVGKNQLKSRKLTLQASSLGNQDAKSYLSNN